MRGDKLWKAHREHYYQRMVLMTWHRRAAWMAYIVMGVCASASVALRARRRGCRQSRFSLLAPEDEVTFVHFLFCSPRCCRRRCRR